MLKSLFLLFIVTSVGAQTSKPGGSKGPNSLEERAMTGEDHFKMDQEIATTISSRFSKCGVKSAPVKSLLDLKLHLALDEGSKKENSFLCEKNLAQCLVQDKKHITYLRELTLAEDFEFYFFKRAKIFGFQKGSESSADTMQVISDYKSFLKSLCAHDPD